MKHFFKQYPNAQNLWKVGEKTFLHQYKALAEHESLLTGLPVEELTKSEPAKQRSKKQVSDGAE